jgi:hypothetical protein
VSIVKHASETEKGFVYTEVPSLHKEIPTRISKLPPEFKMQRTMGNIPFFRIVQLSS